MVCSPSHPKHTTPWPFAQFHPHCSTSPVAPMADNPNGGMLIREMAGKRVRQGRSGVVHVRHWSVIHGAFRLIGLGPTPGPFRHPCAPRPPVAAHFRIASGSRNTDHHRHLRLDSRPAGLAGFRAFGADRVRCSRHVRGITRLGFTALGNTRGPADGFPRSAPRTRATPPAERALRAYFALRLRCARIRTKCPRRCQSA